MNNSLRYRIAVCFLMFSGLAQGATEPQVTRMNAPSSILFIGNSYTYYNNSLHSHVRALMMARDRKVGVLRAMTISGARLKDHAPAIRDQVASRHWDAVVLQGQGVEPIDKDEVKLFQRAVQAYGKEIKEAGAQPVLFMTWAPADRPEYMAPLSASYTLIGNQTDALVVPVGLAFERADAAKPDIGLRREDHRHPTVAGTYLAACTFYAALFRESPVGNAYSAGLDAETAKALQQIAWETVVSYYGLTR